MTLDASPPIRMADDPTAAAPATRGAGARALIDPLLSRRSVGALDAPAPDGGDLDLILDAALRAPDHGRLRPWRIVLIRGAAREALGEVFAAALKRRDPTATAPLIARRRARALAAPLLIGIGAVVRPDHPVPETEQLLSAAAAAMNLLNALHLLGYGGMWVTGADCYDPVVNAALGFQSPDRLIGFIYAGTPKGQEPAAPRPARSDHVIDWPGVDRTGREAAP